MLVICIATVVGWIAAFPVETTAELEHIDITMVSLGLLFVGATTVYIATFNVPVLEVGFGVLTYGYLFQLLDEFAGGPELVEGIAIPTIKLLGLALIFLGFTRTTTRLRADIEQHRQRERTLARQNERLETFASVVSHDLRNPLGIARTYLDFAEEDGDATDFETVREALDRVDRMIENLLTLAEAETIVSDPEPTSVASVAENAWTTTEVADAELSVTLPDEWTLTCNPEFLQNIFENLFRNSVDHNTSAVHIEVGTLDTEGHHGFYIEDDGTGIPDAEKSDIFTHGHTTSENGTGFGLSIVSDLIEAHGWTITVTDGSAGGARFEIETR